MYNSRFILLWIGIFCCDAVSRESYHEALVEKTLSSALHGCSGRKGEQCEVKGQDEVEVGAYSQVVKPASPVNVIELQHLFEPIFPTAAIVIRRLKMDSKVIIDETELVKNIEKVRRGEIEDEKCNDCELSLIFHAQPKKHHCEINKTKIKYDQDKWNLIQLDLSRRLNKIMLA